MHPLGHRPTDFHRLESPFGRPTPERVRFISRFCHAEARSIYRVCQTRPDKQRKDASYLSLKNEIKYTITKYKFHAPGIHNKLYDKMLCTP